VVQTPRNHNKRRKAGQPSAKSQRNSNPLSINPSRTMIRLPICYRQPFRRIVSRPRKNTGSLLRSRKRRPGSIRKGCRIRGRRPSRREDREGSSSSR